MAMFIDSKSTQLDGQIVIYLGYEYPFNPAGVTRVQADGDELNFIIKEMSYLYNGRSVQVFEGVVAKLIVHIWNIRFSTKEGENKFTM